MYGLYGSSSFLNSVLCYAVWSGIERLSSCDRNKDYCLPAASKPGNKHKIKVDCCMHPDCIHYRKEDLKRKKKKTFFTTLMTDS